MEAAWVAQVLEGFQSVWEVMMPENRSLLVEAVAANGRVVITLRDPSGRVPREEAEDGHGARGPKGHRGPAPPRAAEAQRGAGRGSEEEVAAPSHPKALRLVLAHKMAKALEDGEFASQAELAAWLGFTPAHISQMLDLTLLPPWEQEEILGGAAPDRHR